MKESRAPLIFTIMLLFLPVLYVGSYLLLVLPQGRMVMETKPNIHFKIYQYRLGGELPHHFYWPLQQIDRMVRPEMWNKVDDMVTAVAVGHAPARRINNGP